MFCIECNRHEDKSNNGKSAKKNLPGGKIFYEELSYIDAPVEDSHQQQYDYIASHFTRVIHNNALFSCLFLSVPELPRGKCLQKQHFKTVFYLSTMGKTFFHEKRLVWIIDQVVKDIVTVECLIW